MRKRPYVTIEETIDHAAHSENGLRSTRENAKKLKEQGIDTSKFRIVPRWKKIQEIRGMTDKGDECNCEECTCENGENGLKKTDTTTSE